MWTDFFKCICKETNSFQNFQGLVYLKKREREKKNKQKNSDYVFVKTSEK